MKTQQVQALLRAQEVLRGLSFKDSKTTGALEAIQTALADDMARASSAGMAAPNQPEVYGLG